ncbi:hypothetical protein Golax_004757 [Gossypium laxum]|uniref:NAD-dependent epimerase/dehydratase domain-containing protein n=1 Tax=Gossypium laxum TaxID=34288 RepID=A0A7J9A028_9ROSI|nr:hypothetical protein [Gossypium laxum]
MEWVKGGKVCVTGAAGFLASWLVKRLLLSGYHVIGTVRDPANEKKLAHLWRLDGAKERLKLVRADLLEEGSFDDAIMGCQGVFHTASPVIKPSFDPKAYMEILEPAVKGTLNVLGSCKKNPSLRRVVLTSSSSTVRARDDFDYKIPLDETSWSSLELCETLQVWYALAKTQAEKAAWEFCNENKIDLVTVLPAFVIGPSLPPDLCSTASDVLALLKGASGRYLCSSTVIDNDELVSILSARYPSLPVPKGFEKLDRPYYEFNTSKIRSLGFKFRPIEEMFDDCIESLVEKGLLSLHSAHQRPLS